MRAPGPKGLHGLLWPPRPPLADPQGSCPLLRHSGLFLPQGLYLLPCSVQTLGPQGCIRQVLPWLAGHSQRCHLPTKRPPGPPPPALLLSSSPRQNFHTALRAESQFFLCVCWSCVFISLHPVLRHIPNAPRSMNMGEWAPGRPRCLPLGKSHGGNREAGVALSSQPETDKVTDGEVRDTADKTS